MGDQIQIPQTFAIDSDLTHRKPVFWLEGRINKGMSMERDSEFQLGAVQNALESGFQETLELKPA